MFIRRYTGFASYVFGVATVVGCLMPTAVLAHGAKIDYKIAPAISLKAMYDGGEPMSGAQIVVYAPDDPAEPWRTGKTDEQGRYTFTPDPAISGEWAVQARQAGHGAMMHVMLGEEDASDDADADPNKTVSVPAQTAQVQTTGQTPMQRWMMTASVIWGFIGTGLFFSRKRKE